MLRIEETLVSGWEFTLGERDGGEYRAITLPHDWAIEAPFDREMDRGADQGYRARWGVGWYRRQIDLPAKQANRRYWLCFGGVFENSTVWVNGHEAGGHKYGYSSFGIEVTAWVKPGANLVEVRVDNTASPADRWYSGAGIYRPVKWLETARQYLDEGEIVVTTRLAGGTATVRVHTGAAGPVRGTLRLDGQLMEAAGEAGTMVFMVPDAKLWSAEEPNLYTLCLYLLHNGQDIDSVTMRVGLREAVLGEAGLTVNGRAVKLKGVCLHQEVGCRGTAAKPEIWRERLLALKEMGCNALRPSHHTFAAEFLDLCDELGFYVYEECFDKWTSGLYARYFASEWETDVDCMVKRDRNHPCILLWGVGNEVENQGQPSMLAILERLAARVRSLDPTRPVCYAMNPHFKRESGRDAAKVADIQQFVDEADDYEITSIEEKMARIRAIARHVDILGCNYMEQWYPAIRAAIPDKLILGTEIYQFFTGHPEAMQNFTPSIPARVPLERGYVVGGFVWTGYDYLGESMGWPAKGWSGAAIRTNGRRRPSYYLLQSLWREEPVVHFSVMDYSLADEGGKEHWDIPMLADHWHFPQFHKAVIPYLIATNCDEVALYLNDKRFYPPAPGANGLITGFLPWQPGRVRVVGYRGGAPVCRHQLQTPGPAVELMFDRETEVIPAQKGYERLLTVQATDADGVHCFRESAPVRFAVEGPAQIVGVDAGNLTSHEPYCASQIHMYQGAASVQVRLDGLPGRVVVRAMAAGMAEGRAILVVE